MSDKKLLQFKAWMPVTKNKQGEFVGILSDTSLDRDGEFMTKELLDDWATNRILPALANHENKMSSWVGGWKELKTISKGNNTALIGKPIFFSKEANPEAARIEKQVNEALEMGLNPGISIGALPKETVEKEIDNELRMGYSKAEILEATWVPIQSNRNATFGHIAKQFDINLTKPKKVEDCVKSIMADPNFKPQKGKNKEESAWAICQSKFSKKEINLEVSKMETDEKVSEDAPEEQKEEAPIEEETKEEETKEQEVEDKVDGQAEVDSVKEENIKLKKEIEDLKKKSILKAKVDHPMDKKIEREDNKPLTVEKMLKIRYKGGQ